MRLANIFLEKLTKSSWTIIDACSYLLFMCMSTVMRTCSQATSEHSCYNWANGQLDANTVANAVFLSLDIQLLTI